MHYLNPLVVLVVQQKYTWTPSKYAAERQCSCVAGLKPMWITIPLWCISQMCWCYVLECILYWYYLSFRKWCITFTKSPTVINLLIKKHVCRCFRRRGFREGIRLQWQFFLLEQQWTKRNIQPVVALCIGMSKGNNSFMSRGYIECTLSFLGATMVVKICPNPTDTWQQKFWV